MHIRQDNRINRIFVKNEVFCPLVYINPVDPVILSKGFSSCFRLVVVILSNWVSIS